MILRLLTPVRLPALRSHATGICHMPTPAYKLAPLPIVGAEVAGVDLRGDVPPDVIEQLRQDVHKHRLLLFRGQGLVPGERMVEISHWFGELESTFYKHPRSPHPDVFRVSNVRSEGCTGVGRTGWHLDGSFMAEPFAFALYHMVAVPKTGDTSFAPMAELIESLPAEQRRRWERLYMVGDSPGGRRGVVHPLIYSHPTTGLPTLCFHLGMIGAFIWDAGTPHERVTPPAETAALLEEIESKFTSECRQLIYHHKWQEGDFIISDNLAVAHEATPETQAPVSEVGLRVLHRTTIRGASRPRKAYSVDLEGNVLPPGAAASPAAG